MYENDANALMEQGRHASGSQGQVHGNDSIKAWYRDYLGGELGIINPSGTSQGMRYNCVSVFVCPSNPRDDYWTHDYAYYSGSKPTGRVTTEILYRAFSQAAAGTNPYVAGDAPAVWGDVIDNITLLTNHKSGGVSPYGDGGNVSHADGSVRWYPHNGTNLIEAGTYSIFNGPGTRSFPSTAMSPVHDSDNVNFARTMSARFSQWFR